MRVWKRPQERNLLELEFLIVTTRSGEPAGVQVLADDEEVEVEIQGTTRVSDGALVLPVFTSEERLRAWKPEASEWIVLTGREMLTMFVGGEWAEVLINPEDEDSEFLVIPREPALQILDGTAEVTYTQSP